MLPRTQSCTQWGMLTSAGCELRAILAPSLSMSIRILRHGSHDDDDADDDDDDDG